MKTQETQNKIIFENFGIGKIADVVADLVDRIDTDDMQDIKDGRVDVADVVMDAIDTGLIYNDDIWTIMAYYQNPQDANMDLAIEDLTSDLITIINNIIND